MQLTRLILALPFMGILAVSSYDLCRKACIICLDHVQVSIIGELKSLSRCRQRARYRTLSVHVAGCIMPWKLRMRQLAIECAVISIAMGVLVELWGSSLLFLACFLHPCMHTNFWVTWSSKKLSSINPRGPPLSNVLSGTPIPIMQAAKMLTMTIEDKSKA